ncbi:MAG: hypothetical protein M5U28_27150 [Sandaracinaceae bacterium]|nr:hypothetical protein [Sandaracinaceae bacterium]
MVLGTDGNTASDVRPLLVRLALEGLEQLELLRGESLALGGAALDASAVVG